MARNAARIAFDRTEFLITGCAVEAGRLKTHRVQIGPRGPKAPGFVFNRLYQLCSVVLATKLLLHPEQLYEQHRGPDLPDNSADDLVAVSQRDGEALVFLLAHLLGVVAEEPAEHRLLGLSDGALDRNGRHRLAQRHVHRALGQLRVEAALIELSYQGPLQLIAFVEESDAEGKADIAE